MAALDAGFPQIDAFFELKRQLESASSLADVAKTEPVVVPIADQQRRPTSWRPRFVGRSAQQTAGEIFALVRHDLGTLLGKVLEQIQSLDTTPAGSRWVKAQLNDAWSLHEVQLVLDRVRLVVEISSEIDGEHRKTEDFLVRSGCV